MKRPKQNPMLLWEVREYGHNTSWEEIEAQNPLDAAESFAYETLHEEAKEDPVDFERTLEVRKYSENRQTKVHLISVKAMIDIDWAISKVIKEKK